MPTRKSKKNAARHKSRLPRDAVTLLVVLRGREGQQAALKEELRALVAPTRREPGCLGYTLYRSADQPGVFLLHEIWASREHHARHTRAPHLQHWSARKDAVLASRDASFWQVVL